MSSTNTRTSFFVFACIPVGNYHTATTNLSDPDGSVGAEYIKVSDYLGGVELIAEAAKSVASRDDSRIRQYVRQIPDEVRKRLESSAML